MHPGIRSADTGISSIWSITLITNLCYNFFRIYANNCRGDSIRKKIYLLFILFSLLFISLPVYASDENNQAGIVSTASGALNVRESPSTNGTKLFALPKGSYITLLSQNGSWWKVEYAEGKYGYCHKDYIRIAGGDSAVVATASGSLNIRSGGGTDYSKIGSLPKGKRIIVVSESNGWSKVLYHGTKIGYVSSQYLATHYTPVSVWVPNLKQYDSRWAEKIIATSGKTFAQIGCATTALAMMESSRLGYTVAPDEMSEKLKYTATGNVYWPDNYSAVTSDINILEKIYQLLKQGRPVLYGGKKQNGSQHWVVINGFSGGEKLSADKFLIHDPGTFTRTILKDFLNSYPMFYKYFHY